MSNKDTLMEELTNYVNSNIKYYQDMIVNMIESIKGLKPINRKSQTLLLNLGREISSYYVRAREGEYIAKKLGFQLVENSSFEKVSKDNNLDSLMENNYVLNSSGELTTDGQQTFSELFDYLNSNKDAVDKNKAEKDEPTGDSE
jgi:hypothetical protein